MLCASEQTCVGLGLELLGRLNRKFPQLKDGLYIASSEESIEDISDYISRPPYLVNDTEKEHVVVAVKIKIGKERKGVLLLDPGYHIARAITVMQDNQYPHTGWFTQAEEPTSKKEYRYFFADVAKLDYIIWEIKETHGEKVTITRSLVYAGAPFLSPITVTEKRNLVYNFRSLLARSTKGEILAGVYFPVSGLVNAVSSLDKPDGCSMTIIINKSGTKLRQKIKFEHIFNHELNVREFEMINECGKQLGLRRNGLMEILEKVAFILNDDSFISQLLDVNESINTIYK